MTKWRQVNFLQLVMSLSRESHWWEIPSKNKSATGMRVSPAPQVKGSWRLASYFTKYLMDHRLTPSLTRCLNNLCEPGTRIWTNKSMIKRNNVWEMYKEKKALKNACDDKTNSNWGKLKNNKHQKNNNNYKEKTKCKLRPTSSSFKRWNLLCLFTLFHYLLHYLLSLSEFSESLDLCRIVLN